MKLPYCPCLCMYVSRFNLLNHLTDFHEIRDWRYVNTVCPNQLSDFHEI
jgi:hypothetical protein